MPTSSRALTFFLGFLVFTACSTQQARLPGSALQEIDSWTAKGKLGLRYADESQSARFSWDNHLDNFVIRLSGPFGQGAVVLTREGDTVTLRDGKQTRQANSPEELLYHALGWSLPVSGLKWWIMGLPAPHTPVDHQENGAQGELLQLAQMGWHLQYHNYGQSEGYPLPGKLVGTREDIKFTLLIKRWDLNTNRKP